MIYRLATTPVDPTVNSEVEGSVKISDKFQKKAGNQPSVIFHYNQNMGGGGGGEEGVLISLTRGLQHTHVLRKAVYDILKYFSVC